VVVVLSLLMFAPIALGIHAIHAEKFNETHSKIIHGEKKILIEKRYKGR